MGKLEKVDVTDKVSFQNNDDEALPITTCVCGHEYDAWEFIINMYYDRPDWVRSCKHCGAKLCFSLDIRVYQLVEIDS
jgi:hypothetical protein